MSDLWDYAPIAYYVIGWLISLPASRECQSDGEQAACLLLMPVLWLPLIVGALIYGVFHRALKEKP